MIQKITLLYVDDEPINLMLFEAIFRVKYEIIVARSGKEGLEKLKSNPQIEVVISDMRMPEMNGLSFISEAKLLYPKIYYYILSGYDITREIQESIANGLILQYFQKPFKVDEINRAIEERIANE